jgi:hypothetical protein
MRWLPVLMITACTLVLAGCPKKPTTVPDAPAESSQSGDSGATSGRRRPDGQALGGEGAAVGARRRAATVIYLTSSQRHRREFAS